METDLGVALCAVCEKLNANQVEYMIIGGTAVGMHGYNRGTISPLSEGVKYDLDFWYNPTYKNFNRLVNSLKDMECDTSRYENSTDLKRTNLKIEHGYFKTDFLPVVEGHSSFYQAYKQRSTQEVDGIKIDIISLNDLIINKRASGREYDLDDIEELQKRQPKKKMVKTRTKPKGNDKGMSM